MNAMQARRTWSTIATLAAQQPTTGPAAPAVAENAATAPLCAALFVAERAPFADLRDAIRAYFDGASPPEVLAILAGAEAEEAAAEVTRIVTEHLDAARARITVDPGMSWRDEMVLTAAVHAAAQRLGDLRFVRVLATA